ncbi:hypothetical protein [Paenibacillus macerans]|uniref:hypothetical protein n=1 Tax=Paenibacillus macerans TaxID=44252 RepID=UPI00203FF0D3|nr:hypothetical protein [Paenibacillus macerans]MCM3702607.1 hypothetical protein [Paenibacillus macerans]
MIKKVRLVMLILLSSLLGISTLIVPNTNSALAATAPSYTTSYYMGTVDTIVHYDLGYEIGHDHSRRSGKQDEAVILDYGGQNSDGTGATLRYNPDATYDEIIDAVVQFARGYWVGVGSDVDSDLLIIVGTNNSAYQVIVSGGKEWAEMINEIGERIGLYDSQVDIAGGNDMEIDFATAAKTKNWADGYDSVSDYPYYNYGDAAGCTTSTSYDGDDNLNCSGQINTWKMSDIFYVSWDIGTSNVMPQIYNQSMSKQWKNIKKYGKVSKGMRMYISGTLTQFGACETNPDDATCNNTFEPDEAWDNLYDRLNSDVDTEQSRIEYSTDIMWYES